LKSDGGSISNKAPDICIVYKLHLECGRLINLVDWLEVCDNANSAFTCFQKYSIFMLHVCFSLVPLLTTLIIAHLSPPCARTHGNASHQPTESSSDYCESFTFSITTPWWNLLLLLLFYALHRSDFMLGKATFSPLFLSIPWHFYGNRQVLLLWQDGALGENACA